MTMSRTALRQAQLLAESRRLRQDILHDGRHLLAGARRLRAALTWIKRWSRLRRFGRRLRLRLNREP